MGQTTCVNCTENNLNEASLIPNVSCTKNNSSGHSTFSGDIYSKISNSNEELRNDMRSSFAQSKLTPRQACLLIQSIVRGIKFRINFKSKVKSLQKANKEYVTSYIAKHKSDVFSKVEKRLVPIPKSDIQNNSASNLNSSKCQTLLPKYNETVSINTSSSTILEFKSTCYSKIKKGSYSHLQLGPFLIIYGAKSFYFGEVNVKNQRHGLGFYLNELGIHYEGNWVKNNLVGFGRIIEPNGNIAEGKLYNSI